MWYNYFCWILRKRIEVVITGLTRNQVVRKGSWVRIPPLPPELNSANPFVDWICGVCFLVSKANKFLQISIYDKLTTKIKISRPRSGMPKRGQVSFDGCDTHAKYKDIGERRCPCICPPTDRGNHAARRILRRLSQTCL